MSAMKAYQLTTEVVCCVIGASLSEPTLVSRVEKYLYVYMYVCIVRSDTCSNYVEITSGSYLASSCIIC